MPERCSWCGEDALYCAYHDDEWGVVERDDRALYEKIVLDGFQAGLSWIIVLRKRGNFRRAFEGFEPERIARYGEADVARLMQDAGIVRNRAKIEGAVASAQALLRLRDEGVRFSDFLWQFTDGRTLQHRRATWRTIPAATKESRAMAKALSQKGFRFCGPTVCYAFMQAVGMVNDHVKTCFRWEALGGGSQRAG